MEHEERRWWEDWVSPQVLMALVAGGSIVYAAGGRDSSVNSKRQTTALRAGVWSDA